MKKVAVIGLIILGCAVAMGATCAVVKPFGDLDKVQKIVKVVAAFYKGCESREASVVMAELAIVDLAKKNEKDPLPYLQRALKEVKDEDGLRNFTTFLIANCHKEKGDIDAAMETAFSVIAQGEKGVIQIEEVKKEDSSERDK